MRAVLDTDAPRNRPIGTLGFGIEWFPGYINQTVRQHALDIVLLTCVTRGHGRHLMGDESYEVGPGSVGVTHYGQEHDLVTGPDGVDVFNIYLDPARHPLPALAPELTPTLAAILPAHPVLVHRPNRRIQLQLDRPERITALLHALHEEVVNQPPGHAATAWHLLSVLLVACCRAALYGGWDAGPADAPDRPGWLEQVRRHLDAHPTRPATLGQLADLAGVSPEHLCRRFRQYTGRSPIAYLVDRRIQAAMWALRTTEASVLTIAMDCGFHDLAHFNRRFKATTGKTPTAYCAAGRPTATDPLT